LGTSNLMSATAKAAYAMKVLPSYFWQSSFRQVSPGNVHLIIALADHFEPAIDPRDGLARVSQQEQERRLESWCADYPRLFDAWRDHEGRPFIHSYFYPAEQYDPTLISMLAEHCHHGWGEIEVHLHHGIPSPDTAANTREVLQNFCDQLAFRHACLAREEGSDRPRYCFVHGNFALANSAHGRFCGVDSEMQVLAETGCYADMTLPTSPGHPSQTALINSLYTCALPLDQKAPQRKGKKLRAGENPQPLPLIVQGPLMLDWSRGPRPGIENASITRSNPLSLHRLQMWKRAAISVEDRPDWLFIKLHCHGMDPTQKESVSGAPMLQFLQALVEGATDRRETLHFVSAREMVNIVFAACDGRTGNPGEYRDYRYKRWAHSANEVAVTDRQIASTGR
jgi:hypothetical protein